MAPFPPILLIICIWLIGIYMKRLDETESPVNFQLILNYVPYRQKDKFLPPHFSVKSKRSSFSLRSPSNKNKNKFSLKEIQLQLPSCASQIQNEQDDSLQGKINDHEEEKNQKMSQSYIQEQYNLEISQIEQESKFQVSVSAATDFCEDQKIVENGLQDNNEIEPEVGDNQQSFQKPEIQKEMIKISTLEHLDESPTATNVKSIIRTPMDGSQLSQHPTSTKRVQFLIPPDEQSSTQESTKQNKMDESFSSVIKNLKLKSKTPLGQKVKKSKEEDRSNRLLMRFKKK